MTFSAYCELLAPEYGVHPLTIAKRIRRGELPCPPMHRQNKRSYCVVADNHERDTVPSLRAKLAAYRFALADAIRRPMGVVPDSANGLITPQELEEAEKRRQPTRPLSKN